MCTNAPLRGFALVGAHVGLMLLSGCGGSGTKVLKDVEPLTNQQPIATASDPCMLVTLDWVVVRDGPGTWAKNADWDEYLLRVSSQSNEVVQITTVRVVDSLDVVLDPGLERKTLVKGTKQTAKRYKTAGIKVKAGAGVGTLLVAGAAVTAVSVGAASAAATAVTLGGVSSGGAAALGGLLLLGPALAVGGIVRSANNSAVNTEIVRRQTPLPIELQSGDELTLDLFFPLAPAPKQLVVTYVHAGSEHQLAVLTTPALDGLHLRPSDEVAAEE